MPRFVKIKAAKEGFYDAKKPMKILDVYVDNIIISELVETNNTSKVFKWIFRYKTISFDIA